MSLGEIMGWGFAIVAVSVFLAIAMFRDKC